MFSKTNIINAGRAISVIHDNNGTQENKSIHLLLDLECCMGLLRTIGLASHAKIQSSDNRSCYIRTVFPWKGVNFFQDIVAGVFLLKGLL